MAARHRHRHGADRSRQALQDGTDESFAGKVRDECLPIVWFRSRAEVKVLIEAWRKHFDAIRPHSSPDDMTPHEFKATLSLSTNEGAGVE